MYLEDLGKIAPALVLTFVSLAALVLDLVRKGRDSRYVGYLTLGGLVVTAFLLPVSYTHLTLPTIYSV